MEAQLEQHRNHEWYSTEAQPGHPPQNGSMRKGQESCKIGTQSRVGLMCSQGNKRCPRKGWGQPATPALHVCHHRRKGLNLSTSMVTVTPTGYCHPVSWGTQPAGWVGTPAAAPMWVQGCNGVRPSPRSGGGSGSHRPRNHTSMLICLSSDALACRHPPSQGCGHGKAIFQFLPKGGQTAKSSSKDWKVFKKKKFTHTRRV